MKSIPFPQLIIALLIALLCQAGANADFGSELTDSYLESQFDWALFVDVQNVPHYFKYQGSSLHPLSEVRVHYRALPNSQKDPSVKVKSRVYESFWYYNGNVIGSRQFSKIKLPSSQFGAIVIGKVKGNNSVNARAAANVLMRLLLDLHFQKQYESVVLVPREQYDMIVGNLSSYHFYTGGEPTEGKQMSIHVRSYPDERDDVFYYR